MASFQIEGDINGIREKQLQFIRNVLEKRGFKNNKVIVAAAGKAGDNYAATVKRIRVVAEEGDDFMMIAKIAPESEALRSALNINSMFNNEILMYEEVLPKFVSLQKAADVPDEECFKYAECYGCLSEELNEVILLEDLQVLNMTLLDRFSSLSDETVRLILKNFASLHSSSFALKKLEPDTYHSFRSKLIDIFNKNLPEFDAFTAQLEETTVALIDNERYKKRLQGVISTMGHVAKKLKKTEIHSKHLVIQQGDAWPNNIMFKLEDDRPTECIMIDYQLSKESNPVADILYMIFACTDHATRSKHYLDWIDYYHDELDQSLSNYGIKANFVYPKDQLDADLKRYSKLFFGVSIIVYSIMFRSSEEAAVINDAMEKYDVTEMGNSIAMANLSNNTVDLFKSRIEGLIESYLLFGYF